MRVWDLGKALAWICLTTACGGAAIPQENLTSAEAALRAAEVGGALNDPKAALHLKYARDQVETAKKHIQDDEQGRARTLLKRAEIDAELALALARVESARAEARAALDEVNELKRKQEKR